MFQQITITIDLSPEMESDMPKAGDAETAAIDRHSEAIDRAIGETLVDLRDSLVACGYTVEIDQ